MAAVTEALKYEAMSAMCRHMDVENKRLLQSVADKDVIIAAGLQREQAKGKRNVDLYEEHGVWVSKYGELLREFRDLQDKHLELQSSYIKDLAALRVVSNENKILQAEIAAGVKDETAAARVRSTRRKLQ